MINYILREASLKQSRDVQQWRLTKVKMLLTTEGMECDQALGFIADLWDYVVNDHPDRLEQLRRQTTRDIFRNVFKDYFKDKM